MPPPPFSPTKTSRCLPFEPPQRIERSAVGKVGGNWPSATVSSAVIWNGHKIMRNHSSSCWMEVQDWPQRHHCCATPCLPQAKTTSGKAISTVSGNSRDSVTSLGVKELRPHICITKNNKIQFCGSCSFVFWEKIRVAQMHQDWPTKKMTTNLTAPPGHPEWIHLVAAAIHPQDWPHAVGPMWAPNKAGS